MLTEDKSEPHLEKLNASLTLGKPFSFLAPATSLTTLLFFSDERETLFGSAAREQQPQEEGTIPCEFPTSRVKEFPGVCLSLLLSAAAMVQKSLRTMFR